MRTSFGLALAVVAALGCKARQGATTLQDDGAGAAASKDCATGFEPSCGPVELSSLLTGLVGELDAAATTMAGHAGVVSHVGESDAGANLFDVDSDINELRQRLVMMKGEVATLGAEAEASLAKVASLLDNALAVRKRLLEVRGQHDLPADAPERTQLAVVERNIAVILDRIRSMTAEKEDRAYEDIFLWVTPRRSLGKIRSELEAEAGVTNVSASGEEFHHIGLRVQKNRASAVLRKFASQIDVSYSNKAFVFLKFADWRAFSIKVETAKPGCSLGAVFLAYAKVVAHIDVSGTLRAERLGSSDQLGARSFSTDGQLVVWLKSPMNDPDRTIHQHLPEQARRCISGWTRPAR